MTTKMSTDRAKEIYKMRQQIVEPVFGDINKPRDERRFLTRGIKTVRGEFQLICAAVNIKRIRIMIRDKSGDPDGLSLFYCQVQ